MSSSSRRAAFACALALWGLLASAAAAQNEPPRKAGFPPLLIAESPTNQVTPVGHPVAADLGLTPGFRSIIYGLPNGDLYVIRRSGPSSWVVATGWPRTLPSPIHSSPAVGDLDGDGDGDIVVVGFGYFSPFSVGGVAAFSPAGAPLWTAGIGDIQPGPGDGVSDPVVASPAIGDIDGDGTLEVVVGGLDHRLHVLNVENGLSNNAAIWPKDVEDTVFSSAALHDLDGDGRREIIVGVDRFQVSGGRLLVLRFDGSNFPGFPKDIAGQVITSSPAVGDIDGDGKPDIVHGTGNFTPFAGVEQVFAWRCDGSAVPGWPVNVSGQVFTSPALANLDGDVPLEVVVTANNTESSGGLFRVYAFNGTGGPPIFATVVRDFFGQSLSAFDPVVANVLGTATPEILVPTNGEVAIFSSTGTQLTETDNFPDDPARPNLMTQDSISSVAVADLETDGAGSQIEVIVVSGQPFPDQTTTAVHVWNPLNGTSTPPWGFFRHSPDRRGVVPGTASCQLLGACPAPPTADLFFHTITPCRAVDTRNPAGAYGGPALLSGVSRTFDLAGAGAPCGIPAAAKALSINVTVTQPTGHGFITFSPACLPPNVSTINFAPGQTRANNAVQPLSAAGGLTATPAVTGSGTVHLIIDINGYFQ